MGGNLAAGVYKVEITYVTQGGETTPSPEASITTTGGMSTITITTPAAAGSATGYNVYVTAAGSGTETKQGGTTNIGTNPDFSPKI